MNKIGYRLLEDIAFCTLSPGSCVYKAPLCLGLQYHGVAYSLLFWCVRVSPACPQVRALGVTG